MVTRLWSPRRWEPLAAAGGHDRTSVAGFAGMRGQKRNSLKTIMTNVSSRTKHSRLLSQWCRAQRSFSRMHGKLRDSESDSKRLLGTRRIDRCLQAALQRMPVAARLQGLEIWKVQERIAPLDRPWVSIEPNTQTERRRPRPRTRILPQSSQIAFLSYPFSSCWTLGGQSKNSSASPGCSNVDHLVIFTANVSVFAGGVFFSHGRYNRNFTVTWPGAAAHRM